MMMKESAYKASCLFSITVSTMLEVAAIRHSLNTHFCIGQKIEVRGNLLRDISGSVLQHNTPPSELLENYKRNMISILTIVIAFLPTITVGRQMCYNCQYTITSTKQGIECASEYNDTITSGKCPDKCIIHSETNIETGELRSYFRGCGNSYSKNGCSKHSNIEICYYTCTNHFCNGIDIRPPPKNNSSDVTIDQTLLHLILFVFCLCQKVPNILTFFK